MGMVTLPSLDAILQIKDPNKRFEELVNTMGILIKNLSEINGWLTSKNIRANSITADRMNVGELSAITADIGKVTSGEIYGTYIATAEGSYPRAEMSNTADLFGAYSTANRYVKVEANPNLLGAPMANFGFDGAETWITQVGNTLFIIGRGASQINIGGTNTTISGPFNLASHVNFGVLSVPGATDPDEAVTSINVLIGYLSLMGILA